MALFAALSYAVTQSGRGSGTIDREIRELTAAKLMSYMGDIQTAVTRMVLSGINPANLQFNTAPLSGVPCTTGANCVFAPDGGGVAFLDWNNFFDIAPSHARLKFYSAGAGAFVQAVGSSSDEVMMVVTGSAADTLCNVINSRLGLPLLMSLPSNQSFNSMSPPFTLDSLAGKTEGCFRDEAGFDHYGFYYVFLAR